MRLLLRLDDGAGPPRDLTLDLAADVTIGELADHLSGGHIDPTRSIAVVGRAQGQQPFPRDRPVASHGPRSGATVRFVPVSSVSPSETERSPVRLVPVLARDDPTASPRPEVALAYGESDVDGAAVQVGNRVEIRSTGSAAPSVNGERVLGNRRLSAGDLVATEHQTTIVRIDGPLRPPEGAGPTTRHRIRPRGDIAVTRDPVELPGPPTDMRLPGFPVLSAVVPLLMGVVLWVVTRSPAAAVFVLFSFVFVVASGLESRREARAEQRFRVAEFRQDLEETALRLEHADLAEQRHRNQQSPPADTLMRFVNGGRARLWERGHAADTATLVVRLGTAKCSPSTPLLVPSHGRRDLRAEIDEIAEHHALIEMAATVDLEQTGGIAVVGSDERTTAVVRHLLVQLVVLVAPDALAVRVVADSLRAPSWRWCGWLPHVAPANPAPRTLVVVDSADEVDVGAALADLDPATTTVVWMCAEAAGLPEGIRAILELGGETRRATLSIDGVRTDDPLRRRDRIVDLQVDELTEDEALPLARALAPLVVDRSPIHLGTDRTGDSARASSGSSALPAELPISEVIADPDLLHSPDAVLARWGDAARSVGLGAPIGRVGNGVLHLDLRLDGPHALVAGTTGAGKSELLRTLITSLALHHAPDRVTFLLVDYKGGAAFRTLTALPHTVGMITDLNPALARRALTSLRAEIRHREGRLAALGLSDVVDAPDPMAVPPALVVVVDEFATLARELPEFVDGLLDLAQRGRSLGVHLVLATQRPAGVVTDAIRANAALRIALRVADQDDSRDVVEVADAASIPRDLPGRAVLRVGPGVAAHVQIACASGPDRPLARLRSWPIGDPVPVPVPTGALGRSQLECAVQTVRSAWATTAMTSPRRPWLDALPTRVESADLRSSVASNNGPGAAIGWIDRPESQRQDVLRVDLERDGGVLLLGASGSGCTTALVTIAAAFGAGRADPVHIHAIDAGRGLGALLSYPAVGDVVPVADAERVLRLLREVTADMAERRDAPTDDDAAGRPRRLIMVDGMSALDEAHERINHGEATELLMRIAREGRTLGIHVAIAAHRRAEVPAALAAALGCRIHLRSVNEDEAMMAGLDPSTADRDVPPGRGNVHGHEVQIALPSAPETQADPPLVPVQPVGHLPRRIERSALIDHSRYRQDRSGRRVEHRRGLDLLAPAELLIGMESDRLRGATLDLRHHHALVAGPPRSGRTTALATIAAAFAAAFDGVTTHVVSVGRSTPTADASDALERALNAAVRGEPTLVCVDDIADVTDGGGGDRVERVLDQLVVAGRDAPIRVVLAGDIDAMGRSFGDLFTRVRAGRTGVLLQPDPDLHGSLLHTALPRRSELAVCAGRGWVVSGGILRQVQIAVP